VILCVVPRNDRRLGKKLARRKRRLVVMNGGERAGDRRSSLALLQVLTQE